MRAVHMKSLSGAVVASALLFSVGCGAAQNAAGVRGQEPANAQAGASVVVSCEPHQRALVRPVVVNGAAVSHVECVAPDRQTAAYAQPQAATPQTIPTRYSYAAPRTRAAYTELAPARVIPVRTETIARPVRTSQVVYDEPVRVRRDRSVKKSAVIIGSSAAVGAGVGALTKGRKGALIGAAIGGGGAAIWDQLTRRR